MATIPPNIPQNVVCPRYFPRYFPIGRIIETTWEDRTPFEAVKHNYRVIESAVSDIILLEIRNLFLRFSGKVLAGKNKHFALRDSSVKKFRCPTKD
jgi:uncharacterized protein (TIGR03643 family)